MCVYVPKHNSKEILGNAHTELSSDKHPYVNVCTHNGHIYLYTNNNIYIYIYIYEHKHAYQESA